MISNDTLILILFLLINIQTGIIMGLLDSRRFWRRKYDEEVLFNENIRSSR